MAALFRKVRKLLVESNAMQKYALYAIGEIFLVVIGILLAIQISTCNQEKGNRKLEQEYLTRLVNDLDMDQHENGRSIERLSINMILAERALLALKADTSILYRSNLYKRALSDVAIVNDTVSFRKRVRRIGGDVKTLGLKLTRLTSHYSFIPNYTTFNDLTATGKFDLITDRKLRADIQSHYGGMVSASDFENLFFYPHFTFYKNTLNELNIPIRSKMTAAEIRDKIGSDQSLIVAISNLYHGLHSALSMAERRKDDVDELKAKIEAALDDEQIRRNK